jgi:DtxR family Mn-dependent transcriptional regulator
MRLVLKSTTATGCLIRIEARELLLPLELATLVRVRPLDSAEKNVPENACRLSDISPGGVASVVRLLPGCIGPERSRLLDMGLVPGSRLEYALQSPFNGPAAFRVRGTLVALRHSQAEQVLVIPENQETASS